MDTGRGAIIDDEAYLGIKPEILEDMPFNPEPYIALMRAVMVRAIGDYLDKGKSNAALYRRSTAETWLHSADIRWQFSFLRICQALGLDADQMRTAIVQRREVRAR